MKVWLVIDVSYMCHRAFHTAKHLSWKGKPTGVVYGFLQSLGILQNQFSTNRMAFCFEHPHLLRRDVYPDYKRRRNVKELPAEEKQAREGLRHQIDALRAQYLPDVGFKNVFRFDGYESDDIMAAIAKHSEDQIILVTADHDLLQCLRSNVSIYNPQKLQYTTAKRFREDYGIHPRKWAVVKALAGCKSDEVEGIYGIGEATALAYVRGELTKGVDFQSIRNSGDIVLRNRELVELPFKGCPVPTLQDDKINGKEWLKLTSSLGMKSLMNKPPK